MGQALPKPHCLGNQSWLEPMPVCDDVALTQQYLGRNVTIPRCFAHKLKSHKHKLKRQVVGPSMADYD